MKLSLFDLHCDTPYEMFRQKQSLDRNHLAVSLQEAEPFERYVQVMAFWTESDLSDAEGWQRFLQMHQNLLSDAAVANGRARITRTYSNSLSDQRSLILAVEDAELASKLDARRKSDAAKVLEKDNALQEKINNR